MGETATARTLKQRRREQRKAALDALGNLSDEQLRNVFHELGREYAQKSNVLNEVRVRLEAARAETERRNTLTSVGVHISDHAVLRYLERVRGVNMREVREEIVKMAQRTGKLNSGEQYARNLDVGSGMTLGINGITNVVTTLFDDSEQRVMETE